MRFWMRWLSCLAACSNCRVGQAGKGSTARGEEAVVWSEPAAGQQQRAGRCALGGLTNSPGIPARTWQACGDGLPRRGRPNEPRRSAHDGQVLCWVVDQRRGQLGGAVHRVA